jgi:hypothetical protein
MTTLYRIYPTETAAREAVRDLKTTPSRDVKLVIGSPEHDIGKEPVGGFAGPVQPDARVGSFGDASPKRREGSGAFAGDPDQARQGTFGDSDRDLVLDDDGHVHVVGDRAVARWLEDADVPEEAASRMAHELHEGRVLVVTEVANDDHAA